VPAAESGEVQGAASAEGVVSAPDHVKESEGSKERIQKLVGVGIMCNGDAGDMKLYDVDTFCTLADPKDACDPLGKYPQRFADLVKTLFTSAEWETELQRLPMTPVVQLFIEWGNVGKIKLCSGASSEMTKLITDLMGADPDGWGVVDWVKNGLRYLKNPPVKITDVMSAPKGSVQVVAHVIFHRHVSR
jgi:hypothetical protein